MAYLTHSQTAKGASPYSKGCIFSWTNLIHPTQIEFPFGKIKFSGINKLVFDSKGHFWQYIFKACFIQIVWKQNRGAHISSTVGRDPVHFWLSLIYNPVGDAQMLFLLPRPFPFVQNVRHLPRVKFHLCSLARLPAWVINLGPERSSLQLPTVERIGPGVAQGMVF